MDLCLCSVYEYTPYKVDRAGKWLVVGWSVSWLVAACTITKALAQRHFVDPHGPLITLEIPGLYKASLPPAKFLSI